jgi:hypothetical protein
LIAGLPEAAQAHPGAHDAYASEAVSDLARDHDRSIAQAMGHCHPGLDCFTAAAFLLTPDFPAPAASGEKAQVTISLQRKGWKPLSQKPPPRHSS